MPMGASLLGLHTLDPPLGPPSAPAHVSADSPSNISPNPSEVISEQLLKIPPLSAHSAGGKGVPKFCFGLESFYFCDFGAHAKFRNPTTTFENTPLVLPNMS